MGTESAFALACVLVTFWLWAFTRVALSYTRSLWGPNIEKNKNTAPVQRFNLGMTLRAYAALIRYIRSTLRAYAALTRYIRSTLRAYAALTRYIRSTLRAFALLTRYIRSTLRAYMTYGSKTSRPMHPHFRLWSVHFARFFRFINIMSRMRPCWFHRFFRRKIDKSIKKR